MRVWTGGGGEDDDGEWVKDDGRDRHSRPSFFRMELVLNAVFRDFIFALSLSHKISKNGKIIEEDLVNIGRLFSFFSVKREGQY